MHHSHRYFFGFFVLTAALAAPAAIRAAAKPQDNGRQAENHQDDKDQNRVYDRSHKDYHKLGWQRRPFLPSVPRR
jgi:hypothetical protein